jgi:hypothetical protein
MKNMFNLFVTLLVSGFTLSQQTALTGKSIQDSLVLSHMPEWAKPVLEKSELVKNYKIQREFNPYYFEGDFNGDKLIDIAFFVENTIDHSKGLMFINGGKNLVFIVGCGNATDMGSSITWAKTWFIFRDRIVRNASKKTLPLKTPAILLKGSKETNLVVYWSRNKYKTFLQQY